MLLKKDIKVPLNGDITGKEGAFIIAPRGTYAELLDWNHPKYKDCSLVEIKLLLGAHIFIYCGPIHKELMEFPPDELLAG